MKRSKRWSRARRARVGAAAAVAAIGAMVFGAGSAQAAPQPFSATFDDAALSATASFDILDPPNVATMTGTWDDGTHAINVPKANFVFPPSTGEVTSGVTATVNVSATQDITGIFDPATGDLTTNSSQFEASVSLNNDPPCVYDVALAFTTNDTPGAPWPGDPFDTFSPSSTNVTATHGDIQTSWPQNYFTPLGGNCAIIDGLTSTPGGLAFANGLPAPLYTPPAQPPASTPAPAPKKKKCKKKAKKGSAQSAKKKCKKKKK